MTVRRCAGTNRHGEPCQSTIVGADGYCPSHAGVDMSALGRRAAIRSGEARRQRKRTLAQRVDEQLEQAAGAESLELLREAMQTCLTLDLRTRARRAFQGRSLWWLGSDACRRRFSGGLGERKRGS